MTDTVFELQEDLFLSPEVRLLADRPGVDTFIFDGAGHRLILPSDIDPLDALPLILVGVGKTLHFKNLTMVPASSLSSILQLKAGSRILAKEEDQVIFMDHWDQEPPLRLSSSRYYNKRFSSNLTSPGTSAPPVLMFKLRAFGVTVELVDVSSLKGRQSDEASTGSVHKLLTTFDAEGIFHSRGDDSDAEGIIHSLVMDTARASNSDHSNTLLRRVLEPCDLTGKSQARGSSQTMEFNLDQLALNVTPDLVDMLEKVQKQLLEPLTLPQSGQPTAPCTGYDLIWSNTKTGQEQDNLNSGISFWRVQCPSGYGVLGDVATIGELPFSEQALCVSLSSGFVAFPLQFIPVFQLEEKLTVWKPVAPRGFVALGCLARKHSKSGEQVPPSETSCVCVHEEVVVETMTGSCLWTGPAGSIWNLINAGHSFTLYGPDSTLQGAPVRNLRFPLGKNIATSLMTTSSSDCTTIERTSSRAFERFRQRRAERLVDVTLQRLTISTVEFRRLQVEKDCKTETKTGFWRPIPPPGYCWLGDCLQPKDSGPPRSALVFCLEVQESENPCFAPARDFKVVVQETSFRTKTLTLLEPIPKPGYVALGQILYQENHPAPLESFRCARKDLVEFVQDRNLKPSAEVVYGKTGLCFWKTDSRTHTFRVTRGESERQNFGFYKLKPLGSICKKDNSEPEETKTELSCILHCGKIFRNPVLSEELF